MTIIIFIFILISFVCRVVFFTHHHDIITVATFIPFTSFFNAFYFVFAVDFLLLRVASVSRAGREQI
jgi:hypothetical protein